MKSNLRVLVVLSTILLFCRYVHCIYDLPGETSPSSVEIEAGDSVNITCRMNPEFFKDRTVHDLYFVNTITHQRVSNADIAIVNENTILFMLKNAKESKSTYCCMCGSDAIMETRVYVGYKPQPVTNFTCRSYNFEHMKCNFTKPENYVLTQYNVSYHFDLKAYKYSPLCDFKKSPLVTMCTAFETYHSNENIFHYEIVGTNSLGTITQRFDVDSMSVMVLATPGQNFSLRQLTADSATFTFRFKNYSRGLQWEVILQPQNLSAIELSPHIHPIPISNNDFELSLKNLRYAYYEYRIGLRVRLSAANSWSEPFNYWFRTLPRIPDRPPRIDVGGFETDPSDEQIRLYWETLQPYEYNGNNFNYVVEQLGISEPRKPLLLESNSAVFLWKKEQQYNFSIRSRNHEGMSKVATFITIPAMNSEIKRKNRTPPAVYSIYHENTSAFTITWISPKDLTNLLDYTVFWCRKKSLLLNVCEGSIHFERVPRDVNQFTTPPQEHTLSMAVSANYENFNTGLHWTECTMSEKTDLIKMEPKVEATSATSIKIEWGTGNICPSILEGYNLSYCAVDTITIHLNRPENETYNCISDEAVQHIAINKTFKRWELQNLRPYTSYKIEMFMYAKHKFGKKSNSQLVKTWESAPSAPLQLNISHITNTSAIISWLPPSEPNGIVRSYIIVQNNESIEIPPTIDESSGRVAYKLENLSISTLYTIYVLAQTVPNLRSQPSNVIEFRTLVGYPSMPGPVSLHDSKHDAQIKWITPSGRTDFYEVAVTLLKGDEVMSRRISIVLDANSCAFRIPKCFDHEYRTTVDVRSVNAASLLNEVDDNNDDNSILHDGDVNFYDGDDELSCIVKNNMDERQKELLELYSNTSAYRLYKSAWQRGPIFSCAASVLGTIMLYVTLPTFFIGCLMMSLYFMRQKYNKMANIHCTLPAALDAYMTKDISGVSTSLSHNFITTLTGEGVTNQSSNINTESNIQHNNSIQNEELCLLEATSQNSFIMNDHIQHDFSQCIKSPQNISSSLLEEDSAKNFEMSSDSETNDTNNDTNDYLNVISTRNVFNPPSNANSPYVQASDIINQSQHNDILPILPTHNSYIKPNAMTNWQNITDHPIPSYVSAESIIKPRNENIMESHKNNTQTQIEPSQSYISSSDLVTSNNGYTTLDQLNKLSSFSPVANNNISNRNETLPVNGRPAISGYVTPRELNAFGQQHQHQQQHHNFS